jgi:hypothetical protein
MSVIVLDCGQQCIASRFHSKHLIVAGFGITAIRGGAQARESKYGDPISKNQSSMNIELFSYLI